jgi:hypothetical protein
MSEKHAKYGGWVASTTGYLNTTYLTNLYTNTYIDTVTYRPIVRRRLDNKHIPTGANLKKYDLYC